MGSADVFSRASGGGSGSGGVLSGPRNGGSGKRKRRDPVDDLSASLTRVARTLPKLQGSNADRARKTLLTKAEGLDRKQAQRIYDAIPAGMADLRRDFIANVGKKKADKSALDFLNPAQAAGNLLGATLDVVSAPGQAVVSTVAEATRQGGWQHADVGDLVDAALEGAQHKRNDSISSIFAEAGQPIKNPVARFAADFGGGIVLDPLTYLSFGTSALAKSGIKTSTSVLGAERTAEVVRKGAKILTAEEKAALAEEMSPRVYEAFLKGSRGGVKVQVPSLRAPSTRRSLLSEPRTIIPGPFARARAGRIIEGTGSRLTGEAAKRAEQFETAAESAFKRAERQRDFASLADAQGDAGRAAELAAKADEMEGLGRQALAKADDIAKAQISEATAAGQSLRGPITRAADRLGDTSVVRTLRGVFIPRGQVAKRFGEGTAQALDDARVLYRGSYNAAVEDHVNTIIHAAKESGVTTDELIHQVGPALDIGGAGKAGLPENLHPIYDALDETRRRFTQAQIDAGVAHEEALHITDEYFPRYLTKQAEKILKGKEGRGLAPAVPGEASLTRAPSGQLRKRTADIDSPIADINPRYAAEHGVDKFEANPLNAITRRAIEAEQDVATKRYVDEVLKVRDDAGNRLVFTDEQLKQSGGKLPEGYVSEKVPGVGTIHAPREIIDEVKRSTELLINDKALRSFVDGLDRWMTLWKGYATVPLPFCLGFHERNAIGNVFNNWLAGIQPGNRAYTRAFRLQRKIARGRRDGDVFKHLSAEERKIVQEARDYDIVGEGFFGFDLPKNQAEAVKVKFRKASRGEKVRRVGKAVNPVDPSNALIRSGRALGTGIEQNARMAHFIAMRKRFGNAADAARSVRKYLFDYADLTATERHVFKRFMAFYTFTRKNLPLQVGALLQTPGKFSHLRLAQEAIAGQAEAPEGLYPSYLPELGGVPLPKSASGALSKVPFFGDGVDPDKQIVFAPDLPLLNATNTLSPAVQLLVSLPGVRALPGAENLQGEEGAGGAVEDLLTTAISGGAPGAALALAQAFGAEEDFFSGRPLQGRVAAPAYARLPGMSQNRVLNDERQPTITAKSQFLAESLFPLLGKIGSAFPQGAYEQAKAPRRRLSTFAGLRIYPLDEGTERGEALRRNTQIQRLLADLRAQGIEIESSRPKKKARI